MIQTTILTSLLYGEDYATKVIAHLDPEYFEDDEHKVVSKLILNHYEKYRRAPSQKSLKIDLEGLSLPEFLFEKSNDLISELNEEPVDYDWLYDSTEEFCKARALHNALLKAVECYDAKKDIGSIPDILTEALSVSFDTSIGHSYFDDAEKRFEFYHRDIPRIPCDIELLNKITGGGVVRKSMNIILAGTAVGKSLAMCHLAASYISAGYNVLYITLEMAEEFISERIDANLLDVSMDQLKRIGIDEFRSKMSSLRKKALGQLIVKEFPTSSAHVGHFRHLLNELKNKKGFKPDIIFVDYLNICASSKHKAKGSMYEYVKSIAEELRGLAMEFDVAMWTATQTNRDGYSSTDVDLTQTSESFGVPQTADFMIVLISTEELEKLKLLKIKQLKNRYNDVNYYRAFVVGIDRSKMRLYDADQSAQDTITKDENQKDDSDREPVSKSNDMDNKKAKMKNIFK